MLIINADDFGRDVISTDNIIACYKHGSITSATAMVFMADSDRASCLALDVALPVGLHLNLTSRFTGHGLLPSLAERHRTVTRFFSKTKYHRLLYHPLLRRDLEYVYRSQYDEFCRLYGRVPTHIDGHHHIHLSTNMLIDRVIPKSLKVRRNLSFAPGEKRALNRLYRHLVDSYLSRCYICTDYFFGLHPLNEPKRILHILDLARSYNVELMVHPHIQAEFEYLLTPDFSLAISDIPQGGYGSL
jgi:predicted glycoside hydrolase/deacetylase ChbG (UPF0249 family)